MSSSWAVPTASQMTNVRCTGPSSRASSAGPAPGEVSTPTLVCARQTLTAWRSVRELATTSCASSHGIPARAKAAAIAETAGTTSTSRPCSGARSVRTTPKKPGSPSAKTTAEPRCRAMRPAARETLPSLICSARGGTSGIWRWCAAPATSVAAPRAERAAPDRGEPSHPITVTRSAIAAALLGSSQVRAHGAYSCGGGSRRAGADASGQALPRRDSRQVRPEGSGPRGKRSPHAPRPVSAASAASPGTGRSRPRRRAVRGCRRGLPAAGSTRADRCGSRPSRRPRCGYALSRRCAARLR